MTMTMAHFRNLRRYGSDQSSNDSNIFHGSSHRLPQNETQSEHASDGGVTVFGVIIIVCAAIIAFVMFVSLVIYLERRRLRASRASRRAVAVSPQEPESPEERYRNIEKWLVNKEVEDHDQICKLVLQCKDHRLPRKAEANKDLDCNRQRTLSVNTCVTDDIECGVCDDGDEDDEGNECPICFETFKVGDIVSWSPDPQCDHVFHHHCIKEWLLRNKECPFCREIFLPIDRIQGNMTFKKITELIRAQQHRSAHCYYCIAHGVVRPPSHYAGRRIERSDVELIQQRAEKSPALDVLAKMRGIMSEADEKLENFCHPVQSSTIPDESSEERSSAEENSICDTGDDIDEDLAGEDRCNSVQSVTEPDERSIEQKSVVPVNSSQGESDVLVHSLVETSSEESNVNKPETFIDDEGEKNSKTDL